MYHLDIQKQCPLLNMTTMNNPESKHTKIFQFQFNCRDNITMYTKGALSVKYFTSNRNIIFPSFLSIQSIPCNVYVELSQYHTTFAFTTSLINLTFHSMHSHCYISIRDTCFTSNLSHLIMIPWPLILWSFVDIRTNAYIPHIKEEQKFRLLFP